MKTSSAKNKGRLLCKVVKKLVLDYYPSLEEDDIKVTSSGATGEDLSFSPKARKVLPLSIECKSRNRISVYAWLDQAGTNAGDYIPMVVARGNNKRPIAIIDLEDLFDLLKENKKNEIKKNLDD